MSIALAMAKAHLRNLEKGKTVSLDPVSDKLVVTRAHSELTAPERARAAADWAREQKRLNKRRQDLVAEAESVSSDIHAMIGELIRLEDDLESVTAWQSQLAEELAAARSARVVEGAEVALWNLRDTCFWVERRVQELRGRAGELLDA